MSQWCVARHTIKWLVCRWHASACSHLCLCLRETRGGSSFLNLPWGVNVAGGDSCGRSGSGHFCMQAARQQSGTACASHATFNEANLYNECSPLELCRHWTQGAYGWPRHETYIHLEQILFAALNLFLPLPCQPLITVETQTLRAIYLVYIFFFTHCQSGDVFCWILMSTRCVITTYCSFPSLLYLYNIFIIYFILLLLM